MENQFNVGDLVWAKVGRYPWWPSIIYHEAQAKDEARQAKKEGLVLVSFFGDNSYLWLDPKKLFHFESKYSVYSKRSRSGLFVKAVNEAVYEVKHRAAIGMTCPCVFFASYRPSDVEGMFKVDLAGNQSEVVYTVQQIEQFRQEFRPVETLSFVQQLALDPTNVTQDINFLKEAARVLAFRKARYAEVDEPYFLAFGVTPIRPGDPVVASNNHEISIPEDASEAEIHGQKRPKVKSQTNTKKHLKDKLHAAKAKRTVKEKRAKFEVEKKLDFTSASGSDDKKQSLFKEPSMSKDDKEVKSLTMTTKSEDVHFVERVQSSVTSVPVKPEHMQIQRLSEEIHTRYWQQKGQTRVKVDQGSVDISNKMLYLLNKCSRIVQDSKGF